MQTRAAIEMMLVDVEAGWRALTGFDGLEVKLLSDDLDERSKSGGRVRLVRFAPGARTTTTLVHDYWEKVFVLEGQLVASDDLKGAAGPTYSCRPPGTPHGPFRSQDGCLLLEVQYYAA